MSFLSQKSIQSQKQSKVIPGSKSTFDFNFLVTFDLRSVEPRVNQSTIMIIYPLTLALLPHSPHNTSHYMTSSVESNVVGFIV